MPFPLIPMIAGVAGRAVAGTAARAALGHAVKTVAKQAAKTAGQQAAKPVAQTATYGMGRTDSGKTLQAIKPRKQWDWSNMASNFIPGNGDSV